MARMRTVKPETFRSRSLARCPIEARYTFIGLWTEADDHGRGIADPRILKGALYPLDDACTHLHLSAHLRVLVETGHIRLYEVDGETYFEIIKWTKHQAASYRRGEPKYPDSVAGHEVVPDLARGVVQESASRTEDSAGTGNREQGREQGTGTPASPSDDATVDEIVQGELFDDDTAGAREASMAVAVAEPVNAGAIVKALIDACQSKDIALPKRLIGQYASMIKGLLDEGYTAQQIWAALSLMAQENILNRPSLLTNKIVTVQTGPEKAPARQARSTTDDRVDAWLNLDLTLGVA